MWGLETIIRLNNRVERGGIRLVFMTLVLKRRALDTRYPGGLRAFQRRFPSVRIEGSLVAVHAMSGGELREAEDHLAEVGYDLANDSAVGDAFAGPFEVCPGIEFYQAQPDREFAPGWTAVAVNEGMT
jgi:hypothetical protein